MSNFLKKDIKELSKEFDLHEEDVTNFVNNLKENNGFDNKGRLIIRFKPIWFNKLTTGLYRKEVNFHNFDEFSSDNEEHWIALEMAKQYDELAAYSSCFIGTFQMFGLYYRNAGYKTSKLMFDDYATGNRAQMKSLLAFCKDAKIIDFVKTGDYSVIKYVKSNYN